MADYTPSHIPGQAVSYTAGAAITGGQVVELTAANTVGPTSLAVVGVALHDAPNGGTVAVSRGGIQRPIASGVIAVGAHVKAAASGQVVTATVGTDSQVSILGMALDAGTATNPVRILWTR